MKYLAACSVLLLQISERFVMLRNFSGDDQLATFTPKNNAVHDKPDFVQGFRLGIALVETEINKLSVASEVTNCNVGLTDIKELVQLLAQLPGVEATRAVAHDPSSLHTVTIELLSSASTSEQRKLREKAIELATETEWRLSDLTQIEDWYFDVRVTRPYWQK